MSDHENYNVSNEIPEELRRLVCEYRAVTGGVPPSEEEIDSICAVWEHVGAAQNMTALEFGKEQIAVDELGKKIDAESETLEERRRRIENELEIRTEDQGALGKR